MANNVLTSVAETLGSVAAAKRALGGRTWTPDAEATFLQHWRELDATLLLAWLARAPVNDSVRPHVEIIERTVEISPNEAGAFFFLGYERMVGDVHDAHVRDLLVELYRKRVEDTAWTRLTAYATGGPVFTAIRDCELRCSDRVVLPPREAFLEGHAPCSLIAELFAERRDDGACLRLLKARARDPRTRIYTLWTLHETKLLTRVGPPVEVLGEIQLLAESDLDQRQIVGTLLEFARTWPDNEARTEWLLDRWTRAVERGVPWESLWWEIDPELRDEVALGTIKHAPLSFVLAAMSRRWSGAELWKHAMPALQMTDATDRLATADRLNQGLALSGLRHRPGEEAVQEAHDAFDERSVLAWIANTPLPEDADEGFLDAYVEIAKRHSGGLLFDGILVDQLLTLPLTPGRARRILSLSLASGRFWSHPRCVEIAEAAVRAGQWTTVPLPSPLREPALTAYRRLLGEEQAQRQIEHALDTFIETESLHGALDAVDALRHGVEDDRRSRLRAIAFQQSMDSLAALQKTHPWLIAEADVVREATKEGRSWGCVERLPDYLRPVIAARAVTIDDERQARSLLERLEAFGAPRREVLGLVFERIQKFGLLAIEPSWLAKRLDSRALWEELGGEMARAILGHGGRDGANALFQLCFEVARSPNAERLLPVMHTLLGEILVDIARRGILEGRIDQAKSALTGLAHLSPASRLRRSVRDLRSLSSDEELGRLITVVSDLLRREDRLDVPTLDAIHDALRKLAFGTKERTR